MKSIFLRLRSGFTLIQLMASISILAILAGIIAVVTPRVYEAATSAACVGKMRNLHASLQAHLVDNMSWPQLPQEYYSDPEKSAQFWVDSLKSYGMSTENDWLCPGWDRVMTQEGIEKEEFPLHLRVSYHPTPFDDNPSTPHTSENTPWAIEVGGQHPHGSNVLLSDGRVLPMTEQF